jgi:hypothetical protein
VTADKKPENDDLWSEALSLFSRLKGSLSSNYELPAWKRAEAVSLIQEALKKSRDEALARAAATLKERAAMSKNRLALEYAADAIMELRP